MKLPEINRAFEQYHVCNCLRDVLSNMGIAQPTDQVLEQWMLSRAQFKAVLRNERPLTLEQAAIIAGTLNVRIDDLVQVEVIERPAIDENRLIQKYQRQPMEA